MAVAWLGMLVNTGCLYLFKGVLGFRIIPASVLAIEISIIHNFIWLRHWAWRDRLVTAVPDGKRSGGRRVFFVNFWSTMPPRERWIWSQM